MIDQRKAVFLPADKRVLNLFKGYILNGKLLDVSEADVYTEKKYFKYDEYEPSSKTERVVTIIIAIPVVLILLIIWPIGALFNRYEETKDESRRIIQNILGFVFNRKKIFYTDKIVKEQFEGVAHENISEFLDHCKHNRATVYLYSYKTLSKEDQSKVERLIEAGHIASCLTISKLSDLTPFLISENISVLNSLLIITNAHEKNEAELVGFHPGNGRDRNVELLKERDLDGEGELEWNSSKTIIGVSHRIDHYLKSENNAFFSNETIFFIEDFRDEFLNNYILKNLDSITRRLKEKRKDFIYFPAFQMQNNIQQKAIHNFLRYRLPVLYSLTDSDLNEVIQATLKRLKPEAFYKMLLEELKLPHFKRPCLLRKKPNYFVAKPKFTFAAINYQTEDDLDKFFTWYIDQIDINELDAPSFRAVPPPEEYDADWHFGTEGKQLSDELKQKIDAYKQEGKYDALVEAIMYMLETIKEEKPEIIDKVKPLLEKKKLLESKVVLSPLVIDKHYNIFLPAYGNQEVKMHALPKAVYLLFLRYPKGIRFKELYLHKVELLEIYNKVTNKYEKEEIERAINDLVDMTNPSINQKCARIREAFRNIMTENVAKYYYINGMNGEPKCIALPPELITIQK